MKTNKQITYSFSVKDIEKIIIDEIIKKEKINLSEKDRIVFSPIIKNDVMQEYQRFPTPVLDSIDVTVKIN